MATILGNGVEGSGGLPQLIDCWRDVAVEALPVSRPTQALRDTGNSVLAFTRGQLGVVEVGEAGQRLEPLGTGAQCMMVTRKGSSGGGRAAPQVGLQGRYPAPSAGSAVGARGVAQLVGLQG